MDANWIAAQAYLRGQTKHEPNMAEVGALVRDFTEDLPRFKRAAWLKLGLEILGDLHDAAVEPGMILRKRGAELSVDELRAEVEADIEQDERSTNSLDPYTPEQIATTWAWLDQSEFHLWLRVRSFEKKLAELATRDALELASQEDPAFQSDAAAYFEGLIAMWLEDRAGGTDRVALGLA